MVTFISKAAFAVAMLLPETMSILTSRGQSPMPQLRGLNTSSVEMHTVLAARHNASASSKMPCECEVKSPNAVASLFYSSWKKCERTVPRCVFIDLGAANGNTFDLFVKDGYGPLSKCPSNQWSAILVEANPRFDQQLGGIGQQHPGQIDVKSSTAAYMCEGKTSFYLDTVNHDNNYWGSSMNSNAPDVQKSGKKKVTVPTVNLNRVLYEQTIPADWVMVKMDIEGSEYDVLPCLAKSDSAKLIDRLYLEEHSHLPKESWGMAGTTPQEFAEAKQELRNKGVDIPAYFSHTL